MRLALVFAVACTFALGAGAARAERRKGQLMIAIHGIANKPSNDWLQTGERVLPARDHYVIRLARSHDRPNEPEPGLGVPKENILTIDPGDTKAVERVVRQLAAKESVSVLVDMPLGMSPGRKVDYSAEWSRYTGAAGQLAGALAGAHRERFPSSRQAIFGHSAGTEAVSAAQTYAKEHGGPALFDESVVASPRRLDRFAPGTVAIVADGDFWFTPGGKIPYAMRTMNGHDAEVLAKTGLKVLRIVDYEMRPAVVWGGFSGGAVLAGSKLDDATAKHTLTRDLDAVNANVVYYAPHTGTTTSLPRVAMGQLVAAAATAPDEVRLKKEASKLEQAAPTKGLGGVSLVASADVPVDPADVARARYDAAGRRVVLELKERSDVSVRLPPLDEQSVGDTCRVVYLNGHKPELSIGNSGQLPVYLHAPGKQPVYYLGGTEDTLLGLALYRADAALADLAFGASSISHAIASRVPGFHTLPELYPEKYTDHPSQERYGGELRVFIHASAVEVRPVAASEYELGEVRFEVQFARMDAAETMFATFLKSHFTEIAETPRGAPLKDLIPHVQIAALFRWLKENDIAFDAGALRAPRRPVHTPRETRALGLPRLEQIAPRVPTVFFGPFGPTRVFDAAGRESTIRYRDGLPVEVHRPDGAVLQVVRDALGVPFAVTSTGMPDQAFFVDPWLGLVLAEGVRVREPRVAPSAEMLGATVIYPIHRPEPFVERDVSRFLFGPSETRP